jgi:hypothetical protein
MISFTILTSAVADLRDFLIARNFLKLENGVLVGVLPGVEFVEIPNTIVTSLGPPRVYDPRRCFMVKVSAQAEVDEMGTDPQAGDRDGRTKLGKWIVANSAPATVTDATGKVFNGRKVTGQPVWLLGESDGAQIGVWQ